MTYVQVLTPNTGVRCWPGECLRFVSDAFQITASDPNTKNQVSLIAHTNYGTATAAWNASKQHKDQNFPAGCYVPIWFSLRDESAGHVAIMCPNGSVYSSSHPTSTTPMHHPSLSALIAYYANANPLTYLGWSEDIGGTTVIKEDTMPITKEQEITLSLMATGSNPGNDYDYRFTGKPNDQATLDAMLQFWQGEATAPYGLAGQLKASQADDADAHQQLAKVQADLATAKSTLATQSAQFTAEQQKSAGLAKNLNDSQLELSDLKDQLAQAESIASDDDAKIKDLTAKLSSAQAQIDQLKAEAADKPPANLTNTSTPTPQTDSTQNPNLLSNLLGALVSFLKGSK